MAKTEKTTEPKKVAPVPKFTYKPVPHFGHCNKC